MLGDPRERFPRFPQLGIAMTWAAILSDAAMRSLQFAVSFAVSWLATSFSLLSLSLTLFHTNSANQTPKDLCRMVYAIHFGHDFVLLKPGFPAPGYVIIYKPFQFFEESHRRLGPLHGRSCEAGSRLFQDLLQDVRRRCSARGRITELSIPEPHRARWLGRERHHTENWYDMTMAINAQAFWICMINLQTYRETVAQFTRQSL